METELFQLEFYVLPGGTKPAEEFILSLPPKMQVKAFDSLEILEEKGSTLREPYSKSLSGGLFELRIRFEKDISRVFYFFFSGGRIILTNGFIKKTQKTPKAQLILAKKYKDDFERRHQHE